jgi:hypothetical protein
MKKLRRFLNSWIGLLLFLGVPAAILVLWPSDKESWMRWLIAAPFIVVYVLVAWVVPKDLDN